MQQFIFIVLITVTLTSVGMYVLQLLEPESVANLRRRRLEETTPDKLRLASQSDGPAKAKFMPGRQVRTIVTRLQLARFLGTTDVRDRLVQAGYRSSAHEVSFLFARFITPVSLIVLSTAYMFLTRAFDGNLLFQVAAIAGIAFLGLRLPDVLLSSAIDKRQESIRMAWPDALDLLNICVRSGISIEQSIRKVSDKIGHQSFALAEEFRILLAEMSYLATRRQAYENLHKRVDLPPVRNFASTLIQAELNGTPIGDALKTLADEGRTQRMNEAERRAAQMGPKLTIPMILALLPVLITLIVSPLLLKYMSGGGF
ncbi:type II secretion system F family protein [Microvirga sp. BT688]|uniref:type II secretion system F family protein n=1 Tax=Microvirga sp. TaxID=1873136 RepID=UPI001683CE7E|nr:type II secretion system F family protein [Microvirga sp.]MBD2745775.1 type II secretion system F family protein [Microvirga sp.]